MRASCAPRACRATSAGLRRAPTSIGGSTGFVSSSCACAATASRSPATGKSKGAPRSWRERGGCAAGGACGVGVGDNRAAQRLAEILAYRSPLGGGWSAAGAEFDVDASGPLARLSEARATGRFAIDDLALRPEGADAAIRLQRLAGDFE